MKLLLISDLHFGVKKNSESFNTIIEEFFYEQVSHTIKNEKIDQLWILGDVFHERILINSYIKSSVFRVFEFLLNTHPNLEIKVLIGNHDIYYKKSLSITSLKMFFDFHERLEVIKTTKEFDLDGCKTIAFPWLCENSKEYHDFMSIVNEYEETGKKQYDLCLGHFEVHGFEVIRGVKFEGNIKVSNFESFKDVFSGHFHLRQKKGNLQYCGCPYQITWADYRDKKGITIYDTKTREYKFIENKKSPKHVKLHVSKIKNNVKLLSKSKNSWTKFFIDEVISDEDRLQYETLLESYSPLNLDIIDEVEGVIIDDEEVDIDTEFEGNELNFMIEYMESVEFEKDNDISYNDLKIYANELYIRSQSEK